MLDSGVLRHFSQLLTHHRSNIQKVRKSRRGTAWEWSEGKKEDIGLVGKMLAFPSTCTHNIYPSTHSSLLFLTLSAGSSLDHLQHHCWAAPPDPGCCGCWINTTRHWHPGQGKEGPYYPQRSDLTHCRTSFNTLNLLIKLSVSRYHCLGCMHSVCMLDYLVSSPC